jgi:hypothetical protein
LPSSSRFGINDPLRYVSVLILIELTMTLKRLESLRKYSKRLKRSLLFILFICVIISGHYLVFPQLLRFRFRADLTWYDLGIYGFSPSRGYYSSSHDSPLLGFIQTDARCSRDFFFFAPNGDSIPEPGPVILDADGELIWRLSEGLKGVTQDFKVQRYKDEDFLTFWVGSEIDGRKQGLWYMVYDDPTHPGERQRKGSLANSFFLH